MLVADDGALTLSSRMAVLVEIKTGWRRIIKYPFSPRHGRDLHPRSGDGPAEDPRTYAMIRRVDTLGTF